MFQEGCNLVVKHSFYQKQNLSKLKITLILLKRQKSTPKSIQNSYTPNYSTLVLFM